eukprot:scaffold117422_cov70-Phaeocystis_antarctica.AAC.6
MRRVSRDGQPPKLVEDGREAAKRVAPVQPLAAAFVLEHDVSHGGAARLVHVAVDQDCAASRCGRVRWAGKSLRWAVFGTRLGETRWDKSWRKSRGQHNLSSIALPAVQQVNTNDNADQQAQRGRPAASHLARWCPPRTAIAGMGAVGAGARPGTIPGSLEQRRGRGG